MLYSENLLDSSLLGTTSFLAKDLMTFLAVNMYAAPLGPGGLSLGNTKLCVTAAIVWNDTEYF